MECHNGVSHARAMVFYLPKLRQLDRLDDGFEDGNINKWTSSYTTAGNRNVVQTGSRHHDSYHLKSSRNGNSTGDRAYVLTQFTNAPKSRILLTVLRLAICLRGARFLPSFFIHFLATNIYIYRNYEYALVKF